MRGNVIETVMGAVVLVVAALFLIFAYKTSQLRTVSGYEVSADFSRIDGIHQGSDVRISGVKVGTVLADDLDPKTFLAGSPNRSGPTWTITLGTSPKGPAKQAVIIQAGW